MANWNLACPDWADRLRRGASLVPTLPIDREQADRAIAIFNKLRLPDVPGLPTLAEACGDWFRDIVAALFGSLDAAGERRVREVFALISKKNSKTSYSAALMLTALLMNKRPRAEFLLVGPTQAIADLAFGQAIGMVQADPFLQKSFRIQEHLKQITDKQTGAKLKIKTFDARVLTGTKLAGVLIDELHVISAQPDADRVIGQLRGGLLSQPEAFLFFITTQSERQPAGVFRAELMKARAIRDGQIVGATLPVLYEFPDDIALSGEWRNPANWWMVNPNHGRSLSIDRLIADFEGAKAAGEAEVRRWASQHLDIEIGLALRTDRWVAAEYWEACADPSLTLEKLIERSEVIVTGIDGGGSDDLLGFAALGREPETRRWLLWNKAFARRSVLARRKSEAARIEDLARLGDLSICDGGGDDIAQVVDLIRQIYDSGKLAEKWAIGIDPVGAGQIMEEVAALGLDEKIFGVPQGYKLNAAIKTTERKLEDGHMHHAGQALMSWCVGNAKIEQRGNAVMITKAASGTAKIDPLMATFNAVALMQLNPEGNATCYELENRGFVIL
jgi:phage terminase large subunit-like protein